MSPIRMAFDTWHEEIILDKYIDSACFGGFCIKFGHTARFYSSHESAKFGDRFQRISSI